MRKSFAAASIAALLVAGISLARADTTVGPGNVSITGQDSDSFNLIAVDLANSTTLGPGTYTASSFNYQFSDDAVGGDTTGSITPIVLVDSGGNYIPVALGSAVDYNSPTLFISTSFGGSDTFTLSSSTTVYGGLYWDAGPDAVSAYPNPTMPIGFEDSTGDSYIFYGSLDVTTSGGGSDTSYSPGANPPMIGTAVSSQTSEGGFSRAYNFSIDIGAAAVPLPNSIFGGAVLLALLAGSRRCRRVLT